MFGVCVAEMRFHLSHRVKAVLGHWLVVDLSIVAFVVFSIMPHYHGESLYGMGSARRIASNCASVDLTAEQKAFCSQAMPTLAPAVRGANVWTGVAVCATQFVLFALMLLSLSCQVYHKKRSLVVFSVFQTRFSNFFGKYSYTLYVAQIVVIFGPWLKWFVCIGAAAGTCTGQLDSANFLHDWMYKSYYLLMSVVLAVLLQWGQDTFVSRVHMAVLEFLQPGIGMQCWKVLTDEQNPLSGLVLMCWPTERAEAGIEEAFALGV